MWATDPNVKAYLAKPEVSWKSTDFEEGTIFRLSDPAQKAAFMNAKFVRFPPESGPASSSQRLPERRLPRASEAASSSSATYHRTAVGCMKLVNLLRRTLSVTASSSDREVSVLYLGGPAPAPHMEPACDFSLYCRPQYCVRSRKEMCVYMERAGWPDFLVHV